MDWPHQRTYGTGIDPEAASATFDGGEIGGRIGLYRLTDRSCDYDLLLLSVRPEGELVAAITVQATRTLSSPMTCADMRIEFNDMGEFGLTGDFDTVSEIVGPTEAFVELQRAP